MPNERYRIRLSTRGRITLPVSLRRSIGTTQPISVNWHIRNDGAIEMTFDPETLS